MENHIIENLINVPFQSQQDAIQAFWDTQDDPFRLTEDDMANAMGALNGTMGAIQSGGSPMGAPMPGANPMAAAPIDPNMAMGQQPPMDPNMMGAPPVDPNTGMPMDPNMAGAPPVDPMTGQPMMGPDPQAIEQQEDAKETFGTNLEQLKQFQNYLEIIIQNTQDQRIREIRQKVQTILNAISDQGDEILKNPELKDINYDITSFLDISILEVRDIVRQYIESKTSDAKKKFGNDPFGEKEEEEEQEQREEDLEKSDE